MNGEQLKRIILRDDVMKKCVWGVFARDELPSVLFPGGYVVNSGVRNSTGQHWLGLFITEHETAEFMDSLGKKPTDYNFTLDNVYYYSVAVQPSDSILCGLYVLYYMYWRTRGISQHDIMSTFTGTDNDAIVLQHRALMS